MIRHIVAWKFKEYAGGASAMENAMELKKQLEALRRGNLPGLVSMNVQLNCQRDEMEEATEPIIYDVVMDSVFSDGQALEAYKDHPAHKKMAEFRESVRLSRAAVDLIVD